jgi:hypothetical protein
MLTGKDPPITGVSSEADLGGVSIRDPLLRRALAQALSADVEQRHGDLTPLKRELARWFVDHAGEEPSHAGPLPHGAIKPPPLPAPTKAVVPAVSAPTPTATTFSAPRRPRRTQLVIGLALGATVLGLAAAWGVSALRKPPVQLVAAPGSVSASPSSSARAIDLREVPVKSDKDASTGNTMATCVSGYLPKGAFVATPSFDWLCSETDPRLGADRLRNAIVHGGNQIHVTEAMKLFSRIGWYDMPVYAIVRGGCCPDAKPIELPAPIEPCPDMGQALRDIAKAAIASQSIDDPLGRYTKSANCEISANRAYIYKRHGKPLYHQEQTFRELLKAIQTD